MDTTTPGRGARASAARCGWCRTRQVAGATVCPACGRDPSGRPPPPALVTVRSAAARAGTWWSTFVAFVAALEPEYGKVESRRRPVRRETPRPAPATPPARTWWQAFLAVVAALEPEYGKVERRKRATPRRASARPTGARQAAIPSAGRGATQVGAARPAVPTTAVPPVSIRSYDLMAPWRRVEQEARARAAREDSMRVTRILRADPTGGRAAYRTPYPNMSVRTRAVRPTTREDLERIVAERRRAASPAEVDRRPAFRPANIERA